MWKKCYYENKVNFKQLLSTIPSILTKEQPTFGKDAKWPNWWQHLFEIVDIISIPQVLGDRIFLKLLFGIKRVISWRYISYWHIMSLSTCDLTTISTRTYFTMPTLQGRQRLQSTYAIRPITIKVVSSISAHGKVYIYFSVRSISCVDI